MSTHNICFHGEIRKISDEKSALSVAMVFSMPVHQQYLPVNG